jgi:channel protein (hemolysin III family)
MELIPIPGFSEPFSSIVHLVAAFGFFVGSFFLYAKGSGNRTRFFSLFVFSFSVVFLFAMSGVYHLLEPGNAPRAVLQRLDHAAIWLLIAGTFTPIHTLLFRGLWRWGFLAAIWSVAITGLVLEVTFFRDIPEWLSLSFYLGLGWLGILSGYKFSRHYGFHGAKLMVFGGLAYSFGAVLEYLRVPILLPGIVGPHEIFHLFTIAGASFFWIFIYERAGHPIISQIIVEVVERPNQEFTARAHGEKIEVTANSLENIKVKIRNEVEKKFPEHFRPKTILLKLHKEDLLNL